MKQLLGRVDPSELPRLINWIQGSGEPPGTTEPKTSSLVSKSGRHWLPCRRALVFQCRRELRRLLLGRYPDFRQVLAFAILLTGKIDKQQLSHELQPFKHSKVQIESEALNGHLPEK